MLLMVEKGTSGGIFQAIHRYSKVGTTVRWPKAGFWKILI